MSLFAFDNVSLSFSGEQILRDVTLKVQRGERLVVIGRNGVGKTSLLELVAGNLAPDSGAIVRERGLRIGYMHQIAELEEESTVLESAVASRAELIALRQRVEHLQEEAQSGDARLVAALGEAHERYEAEGGDQLERRAALALESVGFDSSRFDQPTGLLSGGERSRLILARMLLMDADLLLLDEPTNHLDIRGTEFLEQYLLAFQGGAVVVSHDRTFFDRFATGIAAIEADGRLGLYPGNYARYRAIREEQLTRQGKEFEQQQGHIAKEEEYIRRTHAGQKARQAKSRIKQLDRLEQKDAPVRELKTMGLAFHEVEHSGKMVFVAKNLVLRPGGQMLVENASFLISRGERVGIIGPNGSGKTTLIKVLAGRSEPESGKVHLGFNTLIGYYDQELSGLTTGRTVLQELQAKRPDLGEQSLRDLAGRFLFHGDDVHRNVETFSGGEQGRLALALLVLGRYNVLLLDEPTNHLDLPSREVLEEALEAFPGTVVVVSHDRAFLNRVAKRILSFEGRSIVDELGNFSELRAQGRIMAEVSAESDVADLTHKQAKRDAFEQRKKSIRADESRKRRIADLEALIQSQEKAIEALMARMADPSMAFDWEGLERLSQEKRALDQEHEQNLAEWERLHSSENSEQ